MSWATDYYRGHLCPQARKAYDQIRSAWQMHRENLVVVGEAFDREDVVNATRAVALDHPELFWVNYYDFTQVISKRPRGGGHTITAVRYSNFFTEREIDQWVQEARQWTHEVVSQLSRSHSKDMWAWQLYDYLARQVSYGDRRTCYGHTIVGPLRRGDHTAVCEGIAKSYKYLCDTAGVPCIVVTGEVDDGTGRMAPHAWNIIEFKGAHRHVDVTDILQRAKQAGIAEATDKFAKRDAQMREHSWNRDLAPRC